ncbi:peptidoglycan DD-metalloendopeptidase family protein [Algoriphagus boritolerans]|uniref:Peptidase family M23 n=1 Tax=Algoriphagus boritolerans DSM 17298 = JCM 18970 TaxID=1120964 RepID=A0A1H5SPE9_9BACT|nr:peptidoglycan DD-metalloendopeptidase family protein [Algoriphagus boritolerans]SEF52405.1 Peptidase family M23 [Algoriphagus boritolerans DSM 17298 = JCM 18970]
MNNKRIGIAALILTLGVGAMVQFGNLNSSPIKEEVIVAVDSTGIEQEKQVFLYGINVTGLSIVEGTVSKNQTLGSILTPFNVPYQIIDEIAKKSKEVFDVRWISANKKFTILQSADSPQAQFFIYEPNPAEYVVFNLDSMEIYKAEKPAIVRKREIGGVIETSLYVDMVKQGISPEIIDQFADLYGWSVDFQRLQKGDLFKVVFEEKIIDDQVVSVSEVQLAYFEHMGQPFHAIPFEQNGQVSFFDQHGNSFKKAFLRDPLKYTRISSKYNLKRFHPVQKRYKPHLGTDYAAKTGTEIRTVGDGTVVEARYSAANGNYVKIKHNGTYTTQYLHMSKIGKGIKAGTRVSQGQVIGYVGSTGLATGPHLCFRFWKNGKQEDWLKEKIPPSEPVLEANISSFNAKRDESLRLLAEISTTGEKKLVAEMPNQTQTAEQ